MTVQTLPPIFIADALALDFVNTVATPSKEQVDWLWNGQGLLDWLERSRILTSEEGRAARSEQGSASLDRAAAEARELREWFRGLVLKHMGHALEPSVAGELAPLNDILRRDAVWFEIAARASGEGSQTGSACPLIVRSRRTYGNARDLVKPIAGILADFLSTENLENVKVCGGHRCTLLFVDHSRSRHRRYCSAAVCGNRAKVAAFRARAKEAG
jgi:predicted RNA-binding Zn ribbon-like protein